VTLLTSLSLFPLCQRHTFGVTFGRPALTPAATGAQLNGAALLGLRGAFGLVRTHGCYDEHKADVYKTKKRHDFEGSTFKRIPADARGQKKSDLVWGVGDQAAMGGCLSLEQ
jgi:hypothetical protein